MNKLQQLIEAAKAATPGPWEAAIDEGCQPDMQHGVFANCNDLWITALYRSGVNQADDKSEAAEKEVATNATFIALANPATILELCALLETCEAALLEAEDFCSAKHVGFQNLDDALAAIKQWKEKT